MGHILTPAMLQLEAVHSPLAHYQELAQEAELLMKRPERPQQVKHWLKQLPPLLLLKAAQELADELAKLQGHGHTPQNGCFHVEAFLGDADVLVEFEHEGASGDGWNEPRYEESITPLCVLINGTWVDCDQFAPEVLNRWHEKGWEHLKDLAERDAEDRAAAQYADRMDRCHD